MRASTLRILRGFFFFWHEGRFWFGCFLALSLVCSGCFPHAGILSACDARRLRQWPKLEASAWLLGPSQWQRPAGRWHRLLLLTGPWKVAVILRQVYVEPRMFRSGSSKMCAFPGE